MSIFQNAIKRIDNFRDNSTSFVQEAVESLRSVIEDLNTAQLQKGLRPDGTSLPPYSPVSVAKYGKPAGAIRLFDQGDFYRGITLETGATAFELVGNDSKTGMLTEAYGVVIGLTAYSLQEVRENVLIELQKKAKEL